jgi:uncharacterized protein (DUF608 family)
MSPTSLPFSLEDLHRLGPQRTFRGAGLSEIAFPLGGLGTGTVSLGGRGQLRDFEIFNRPAKGNVLPFTFFALWAQAAGQAPVAKILEGQVPPPYRNGFGEPQPQLNGVSRFAQATFQGAYPTATMQLTDPAVPVTATLTAWNPFIPLNVHDSALPVAIFEWTFTNPGDVPVAISLAASLSNPLTPRDANGHNVEQGATNTYQAVGNMRGVLFSHPQADPQAPETGTLALTTTWADLDVQTHWYRGGWWDRCHIFWDDFAADGRIEHKYDTDPSPSQGDVSSLVLHATVPAGGSITLPVLMSWHFPRMVNPWRGSPEALAKQPNPVAVLDTYVGAHFADAWAVAHYVSTACDRLRAETDCWRDALFASTLPTHVLDAVSSQASIMRSPTCFLLADGNFFAWEGCADDHGCCHGSCTHVWNYEQALAFLFPQLERSMRRTEFLHNTRPSGNMAFRTELPPGSSLSNFKPCADGQMGAIMQVYRDWQLSGDDDFLTELWPQVKRALEYAWTMTPEQMDAEARSETIGYAQGAKRGIDSLWDPDKDGVMEGEQHNTYDIEFFGPNTLCTALYLGALRACEQMARYLGEPEKVEEYRAVYESGRRKVDDELWNGEYYIQQVKVIPEVTIPDMLKNPARTDCPPTCACKQAPGGSAPALADGDALPKYQYGLGCLSDQLLGQWAAHVFGLGYLLDPAHVATAVRSIFTSNFRAPIGGFSNVQRVYALNEEAGLLLCSWPHGNRPALPFVYADEVWTGIEYHVAAHLIYEGWIDEGLSVVKAVRDRYAGYNRNPWNEFECGHHYARAMASWSVKLALDGFTFSATDGRLGFAPKIHAAAYRTVWSTGTGWGEYAQNTAEGSYTLTVRYGTQTLRRLDLTDLPDKPVQVRGPLGTLTATREQDTMLLAAPLTLQAGETLRITVG